MRMKNPTSDQFKRVIANFDKVLPHAQLENHLDMYETSIADSEDEICGTPMCHGGWYAAANNVFGDSGPFAPFEYEDGAELLAKHLGFEEQLELEDWASLASVWGNTYGEEMFSSRNAFSPEEDPEPVSSLYQIRNWWAQVHNRVCPNADPIPEIPLNSLLPKELEA